MGRGSASKAVRRTNRALVRGNALGGSQHAHKNGVKWSRKDVLEVRKALLEARKELSKEGLNTAYTCEKTMKGSMKIKVNSKSESPQE